MSSVCDASSSCSGLGRRTALYVDLRALLRRIPVSIPSTYISTHSRFAEQYTGNVDTPRMNLMHAYFPAEVREKRKENKREVESEMAQDLGWRVPDGAGEGVRSGGTSRNQDGCVVQ